MNFDFGSLLALGVSFGLVMGLLIGHPAIGITTGLLLATVINAYAEKRQGKKNATAALVVTSLALLLIIGLWIATLMGWL